MASNGRYERLHLNLNKLGISIFLFCIWGICFLIRLTPLIEMYAFNLITALVVKNTISIWIIAILLLALYIVEKKQFFLKKASLEKNTSEQTVFTGEDNV